MPVSPGVYPSGMTGYRDEDGALRAQVDALKSQLRDAHGRIDALEGRGEAPEPSDPLVGAPLRHESTVAMPDDETSRAALARIVRARTGYVIGPSGRSASAVGLDAWDGDKGVRLDERGATITTDASRLPIAVVLGPIAGMLGALPLVIHEWASLHDFDHAASIGVTLGVTAAAAVVGAIVGRVAAKGRARRLAERHRGLVATLREAAPRVRVEVTAAEAEEEHEATRPARARENR